MGYVRINGPTTSGNIPKEEKSTEEGITNRTILQRYPKDMDMCFNWLGNWYNQKHSQVY